MFPSLEEKKTRAAAKAVAVLVVSSYERTRNTTMMLVNMNMNAAAGSGRSRPRAEANTTRSNSSSSRSTALVVGSCSAALASLLTGTFLVFAFSFMFFSLSGGVYAHLLPSVTQALGALEKVAAAEVGAMVGWEKVDWKTLVQGAALVFGWNALLGGILLVYQWSSMGRFDLGFSWFSEGLRRLRSQGGGMFSTLLNLSPFNLQQMPFSSSFLSFPASLLPGAWASSNLATVTLLFSLYMKFGKEIKTCASYLVSRVLKKKEKGAADEGEITDVDMGLDVDVDVEESSREMKSHPLESLGEEFIGRRDLLDLKRRIQSLEAQVEEGKGKGGKSSTSSQNFPWKHLSQKQSAQLSSHQWVRSNGEEGNRLMNCPESSGLQMLVKTVFEGVDWKDVADFWINDDFRGNWDRCFVSSETVLKEQQEEQMNPNGKDTAAAIKSKYNSKGVEVVRWVRKFPAFCGNREYIIARRSFYEEETNSVYVVSKSVDFDMPPQIKRVKEYYSSWRIRVVPSPQSPGKLAVETVLLHYEDLGVPNSIFRLAMRTFFGWFITGLESNGLREFVRQKDEGFGMEKNKQKQKKKQKQAVVNLNKKKSGSNTTNGSNSRGRWREAALLSACVVLLSQRRRLLQK